MWALGMGRPGTLTCCFHSCLSASAEGAGDHAAAHPAPPGAQPSLYSTSSPAPMTLR